MVFFRIVCQYFTSDAVFYAFGRSSFGLFVNTLRLMPYFIRSDGLLSGTIFFQVVCERFTPDTTFYAFGRSSFTLCVNALRVILHFMRSDGVLSGYV